VTLEGQFKHVFREMKHVNFSEDQVCAEIYYSVYLALVRLWSTLNPASITFYVFWEWDEFS